MPNNHEERYNKMRERVANMTQARAQAMAAEMERMRATEARMQQEHEAEMQRLTPGMGDYQLKGMSTGATLGSAFGPVGAAWGALGGAILGKGAGAWERNKNRKGVDWGWNMVKDMHSVKPLLDALVDRPQSNIPAVTQGAGAIARASQQSKANANAERRNKLLEQMYSQQGQPSETPQPRMAELPPVQQPPAPERDYSTYDVTDPDMMGDRASYGY